LTINLINFVEDYSNAFVPKIDDITGFLTTKVDLARAGVYKYTGKELGLEAPDNAERVIGVLRHPDEVFHPDSIKSFTNIPITDDHPQYFVNTDNIRSTQKGQVSGVQVVGNYIQGIATITDKDLIEKILGGKIQVSPGYSCAIKKEAGVYNGEKYEYAQKDIRANHLAVVSSARGGSGCKFTDKKGEKMALIKINDVSVEVSDNAVTAFQIYEKTVNEAHSNLKKKLADSKGAIDKLQGEVDALKKAQLTDEQVEQMVADRAKLVSDAIAIDKTIDVSVGPSEIKKQVIVKVLGIDVANLNDKSAEYIGAMYDTALLEPVKKKMLNNDFDSMGKKITTPEKITDHRAEYIKRLHGGK